MDPKTSPERPWYKKKRYILPTAGMVGFLLIASGNNSSTPVQDVQQSTPGIPAIEQVINTTPTPPASDSDLSNDNYYINTYGNRVHSPAYSESGEIPVGASARCRDGTYSFSQSRRGTCSHHGGVAE